MYLTILKEVKPGYETTLYHYGVSKYKGTSYIKFGTTCELRTINKDFNLNLKESSIKDNTVIKLKEWLKY